MLNSISPNLTGSVLCAGSKLSGGRNLAKMASGSGAALKCFQLLSGGVLTYGAWVRDRIGEPKNLVLGDLTLLRNSSENHQKLSGIYTNPGPKVL